MSADFFAWKMYTQKFCYLNHDCIFFSVRAGPNSGGRKQFAVDAGESLWEYMIDSLQYVDLSEKNFLLEIEDLCCYLPVSDFPDRDKPK